MFSSHVSRLASRCRTLSRVRAMSQTSFAAGTKLLVCDMAGTTVDEGGAVYVALFDAMGRFFAETHMVALAFSARHVGSERVASVAWYFKCFSKTVLTLDLLFARASPSPLF